MRTGSATGTTATCWDPAGTEQAGQQADVLDHEMHISFLSEFVAKFQVSGG